MSYSTGRIYRIVCLSNPEIQYVGSTYDTLRNRLQQHKQNYPTGSISLYEYIKKDPLGWNNFKMILIKEYKVYRDNVKDTKHLRAYEQLWMNKLKCVNKKNAFVPQCVKKEQTQKNRKVYYQENKEQIQKNRNVYYQENKEQILEKNNTYRLNNPEKFQQYNKVWCQNNPEKRRNALEKYYQNNKEQILERHKIYLQNNKEKRQVYLKEYFEKNSEKIKCECGSSVVKYILTKHKKTIKHITFVNNST